MPDPRPNILLIHADQHRGDCLGVENHPVLRTPTLDSLAHNGVRLSRFYSAAPSCIAARRSLMLGQSPQKHGLVGFNSNNPIPDHIPTLPQMLRDNGYHTYHVGRSMHQAPLRKRYGFDDMELATSPFRREYSEYAQWFKDHCPPGSERQGHLGAGIMNNDWPGQPWHMPDHLHPTNWTVDRALNFLERRDPSQPYFLSVGFIAPHPPLQPPQFFFDRYLRTGVPQPHIGDWATPPTHDVASDSVAPTTVNLEDEDLLSTRAAYYGLINHVDTQLRRLLDPISGVWRDPNLIVIYLSDHGEGLGDHYLWRKSRAFESTARCPFILRAPKRFNFGEGAVHDYAATHADLMPTLLDMLDIETPDTCDGHSLVDLMSDGKTPDRERVHIEHTPYHHALTDGKQKYIWDPKDDSELFFDLTNDPNEMRNLAQSSEYAQLVETWRSHLIKALADRPEGFVKDGRLSAIGPWSSIIPGSQSDY